jgi:hypothetical protein
VRWQAKRDTALVAKQHEVSNTGVSGGLTINPVIECLIHPLRQVVLTSSKRRRRSALPALSKFPCSLPAFYDKREGEISN